MIYSSQSGTLANALVDSRRSKLIHFNFPATTSFSKQPFGNKQSVFSIIQRKALTSTAGL